jgi:hypothetical protein
VVSEYTAIAAKKEPEEKATTEMMIPSCLLASYQLGYYFED